MQQGRINKDHHMISLDDWLFIYYKHPLNSLLCETRMQ